MNESELLARMANVEGYLCCLLVKGESDLIASHYAEKQAPLSLVSTKALIRNAHMAARAGEISTANETLVKSAYGIAIIYCSGEASARHFHLIALFTADANQALAKITVKKIAQECAALEF